MKKFIEEFKTFALRGNMMDMAVGILIGGAFSGIVTSLTDNFITPILKFITGAETYDLQDVAGFASSFVSALVNFFIMALVLFCLLKVINKLMKLGRKRKRRRPGHQKMSVLHERNCHRSDALPHCTSELHMEVEKE